MCPFGKDITPSQDTYSCWNCFCNVIWIIFCGLIICILEGICGVLYCITICGIPFGLQHFKLAKIALMPFGAVIVDKDAPGIGRPLAGSTPPPVIVVQQNYAPYTPPATYY